MLTKLFAAPVKAAPQYADWLQDISLARYNPNQAPIPQAWIRKGFYTELEITSTTEIFSRITEYVLTDINNKRDENTIGKLLGVLLFEYQDHPQLQLFCADKLTKVKKAPPLVREISELVRIIAHVKIDRDYINAVNNLAKLIEKIEKKGIADMEAPVFDQLTKVLELDEKGNHEKAEDIFQKAYKKTKRNYSTKR